MGGGRIGHSGMMAGGVGELCTVPFAHQRLFFRTHTKSFTLGYWDTRHPGTRAERQEIPDMSVGVSLLKFLPLQSGHQV